MDYQTLTLSIAILTQWLVIFDKRYLNFEFVVRWKVCSTIKIEITIIERRNTSGGRREAV